MRARASHLVEVLCAPLETLDGGRAESRDELAERTLDSAEAMVKKQLR
jgi:hypothetical protein